MFRSASSRGRRRTAVAVVAGLALVLAGLLTSTATAGKPAGSTGSEPVAIRIDRISSGVAAPSGLPAGAAPYVIVQKEQVFSVEVSFLDAKGKSTFFGEATTLTLQATSNNPAAVLSSTPVVVPKGARTAVVTGSIGAATNEVRLTVQAGAAIGTAGDSQVFDVLSEYRTSAPTGQQGIGGSDGSCAEATEGAPVCGSLLLPNGAGGPEVLMSLGACDAGYAKCGDRQAGSVVQVLADLTAPDPTNPTREVDLYTNKSPATLVIKCDTTLCETAAIQSIPVNYSLEGNGVLTSAPACPRKGTVGQNQVACVDYVQSKRDGASDTILYLLFTRDIRTGIG